MAHAPTDARYFTVDELAAELRVDPKTIRAELASGRISFVRVGRLIRIPRRVLALLETQARVATPEGKT